MTRYRHHILVMIGRDDKGFGAVDGSFHNTDLFGSFFEIRYRRRAEHVLKVTRKGVEGVFGRYAGIGGEETRMAGYVQSYSLLPTTEYVPQSSSCTNPLRHKRSGGSKSSTE